MQDAARNDQVVPGAKGQLAQLRFKQALALADENQLVGQAIAIIEGIGPGGLHHGKGDILVEQDGRAVQDGGESRRQPGQMEMAHPQGRIGIRLQGHFPDGPGGQDTGRPPQVIEEARGSRKAFAAQQLLVVQPAAGLAEDAMAFAGHLAQRTIERHISPQSHREHREENKEEEHPGSTVE